MSTTQEDFPVKSIQNDLVLLSGGEIALVMQTSAVNFGLLSGNEQVAIIGAFAGLINSLSFPIQIVIRSKRLDISSYLVNLDQASRSQGNPLLSRMIIRYRNFIEQLIRDNQVLDKQFYVILPLWSYEVGVLDSPANQLKKALNIILPRKDHLIRQLAGIGLIAHQLTNKELVTLFFDIYNADIPDKTTQLDNGEPKNQPTPQAQSPSQPQPTPPPDPSQPRQFNYPPNLPEPQPQTVQTRPPQGYLQPQIIGKPINPRTPFVVEELADEYGTI